MGDHGAQEATELQPREQRQRMLWLLAHLTCTDGRVVGDHGAKEASELQLLEHRQHVLWLLAHLSCADGRFIGDRGAPETSELQLGNRGSACCGFWPINPAPMAAS